MNIMKAIMISIFYTMSCLAWNSVYQHPDLKRITFDDPEIQALANQLGLDLEVVCQQINEPPNTGPGTAFESFNTWENLKNNWSYPSDLSSAFSDLMHYIQDSSVPVNHTPGGYIFNRNNSTWADYAEDVIEFAVKSWWFQLMSMVFFISIRSPHFIKNHSYDFPLYNENIYQAKEKRDTTTNYVNFYNNLLLTHQQAVEAQASSYKAYVEDRGKWIDPTDYMVLGYSEAISLGREIAYIYLYCNLHPEAWENPPAQSVPEPPDITPILNLLLDD